MRVPGTGGLKHADRAIPTPMTVRTSDAGDFADYTDVPKKDPPEAGSRQVCTKCHCRRFPGSLQHKTPVPYPAETQRETGRR